MLIGRVQAMFVVIAALACFCKSATADNSDYSCGDISITGMNWASAEITTAVDNFILTEGFGCAVQINSVDAVPALASMRDTGKPDVIPELWASAIMPQIEQAVDAGTIKIAVKVLESGSEEGWWVPSYIIEEHPEIKSVEDALARADLFPSPNDEAKAALHNCPAGWDCNVVNANLFKAYGAADKGFELISANSAASLDASLVKAYENKIGWIGYYWSPTSILGRYAMTKLDAGVHNEKEWETCTSVAQCDDPQPNAWLSNPVYSVVSEAFAQNETAAMSYVSNRQLENDTVNTLLNWMTDNQASGDEVARHFIAEYESVWTQWVPADVVPRLKFAIVRDQ